ncbi:MAG: DNA-processing protein DprA [Candidatus Peribacteraceae bacterium]|nr:DNA-processing protein DprA [Candidatus Peribacteraceae bacterium]
MEKYFAALNSLEKVTPLRFARLLRFFQNDPEKIWQASRRDWQAAGIEARAVAEIFVEKDRLDPDEIFQKLEQLDIKVLPITSEEYPKLLKAIYDPPPVLLVRGQFPTPADDFAIAVVGARVLTSYGRQVTTEIARGLAAAGISIISGLALGADAAAHAATLELGGRTVAVLGNGIDAIYPPRNQKLAEEILQKGGAIISEFPAGTPPNTYNFPLRNRIIAGLVRGIVVTEGREKSGSLITASLANEFGREVFAVPGPIFSENSVGPVRLIQSGARPIVSADDVIDALELRDLPEKIRIREVVADSAEEAKVLNILQKTAYHSDEISRLSGMTASEASAILSLLEMKGLAKNLGGMNWVRT